MSKLNEYLNRILESIPQDNDAMAKRMHNKMHKDVPDEMAAKTLSGSRDERVPADVEAGLKKTVASKLATEDHDSILKYIEKIALGYIKDPDEAGEYADNLLHQLAGK